MDEYESPLKLDSQPDDQVYSEDHGFTHKTARYLVPSLDADDEAPVAAGADAAELEADTAWTGRLLATEDAEVGVASEPELSLGTHAAEAEDRARARATICLVENIFEVFYWRMSKEWMEWKPVPWLNSRNERGND